MRKTYASLGLCACVVLIAAGCQSQSCQGEGEMRSCGGAGAAAGMERDARTAGASGGAVGTSDAGPGMGGMGGSAGPGGEPMRLDIAARAVPSGGEDHICVTLPLPNETELFVRSIHATLTNGSHHLIVDRREPEAGLQEEPAPCAPTMGGDATRLIIAQQHETTLALPPGTGMRLAPHQPVFLQLHYINVGLEPIDIVGTVEFEPFEGEDEPIEALSLFTGATSFSLPAGEETTVEHFVQPSRGRPVQVFAMTSHTHSLGVEATIERVAKEDAPDTTPLHRSLSWEEPPLTTFDPPLTFDGSDGLRLRCRYVNDSGRTVTFGTAFEDEMCFMWLYYFEQP